MKTLILTILVGFLFLAVLCVAAQANCLVWPDDPNEPELVSGSSSSIHFYEDPNEPELMSLGLDEDPNEPERI